MLSYNGLRVWSIRYPAVLEGPAYWSISPALQKPRKTPGGHPLGFTSDAAYFPAEVGAMLGDWLVMPANLPTADGDAFYSSNDRCIARTSRSPPRLRVEPDLLSTLG